jgi:hypothetical protein
MGFRPTGSKRNGLAALLFTLHQGQTAFLKSSLAFFMGNGGRPGGSNPRGPIFAYKKITLPVTQEL